MEALQRKGGKLGLEKIYKSKITERRLGYPGVTWEYPGIGVRTPGYTKSRFRTAGKSS